MFEGIRERIWQRAEGAVVRAVTAAVEGRAADPLDGIVAGVYLGLASYAAHRFGGSPEPRSRAESSAT